MRDIGKNIRALRMRKNMTQDELAEKLFVTRQTVSNYETGRSRPDVEMLLSIAAALDTDANTVLYGPPVPEDRKRQIRQFCIGAAVTLVLGVLLALLWKPAMELAQQRYMTAPQVLLRMYVLPVLLVALSWAVMSGIGILIKAKPLDTRWAKYGRWAVFGLLVLYFALLLPNMIWYIKIMAVDLYLATRNIAHGTRTSLGLYPEFLNRVVGWLFSVFYKRQSIFLLFGVLLWVLGFPKRKANGKREKQWLCAVAGLCLGLALYAAAEREYVLTLEPGTQVEKIPFHTEIEWREDENEEY